MSGAWPYFLCVVPGFTSTDPALLCFDRARGASTGPGFASYVWCFAYFDSPRGALLCLAWPYLRHPPGCLRALPGLTSLRHPPALLLMRGAYVLCFDSPRLCALLCFALLCFASTPPGGALLACFALLALLAYVLTCFLHILRAVTLVVYMRKR